MPIEQVNVTRNQSTLKVTLNQFFLFDNRYEEGVFLNNTGGDYTLAPFTLVLRDIATPGQVKPAIAGVTLADVIGITANVDSIVDIADAATVAINYGVSGTINEDLIVLPAAVTLDTVVANKTVRDILEALGFHLTKSIENTKFDNV